MNNQTQRANYNDPILLLANQHNFSYPDPEWNVYNVGTNKTIRIVMNNKYQSAHPMHFHGHNFVSSPSPPLVAIIGRWKPSAKANDKR